MATMPSTPDIELRKTGRQDTRQGFSADEYEVLEDGQLARRLWVAPWSEIDGGSEARDGLMSMVEFFEELLAGLPTMPGASGPLVRNPFGEMNLDEGFPVFTQELGPNGEVESESALTTVERRSIDPDAFEPPTGYTLRTIQGG